MSQELTTPNEVRLAMERIEGGTATFSDVISIFGLPGNSLSYAAQRLAERKLAEARERLLQALEKRQITVDEAIASDHDLAVVYRFFRSAEEGTVSRNIRLLAETIGALKKDDMLTEDTFNAFLPILRDLTYEQIVVAGRFYSYLKDANDETSDTVKSANDAWKQTREELVPDVIETKEYIDAICAQLVGLGLFVTKSGFGSINYEASPILERIIRDTSFNEMANVHRSVGD